MRTLFERDRSASSEEMQTDCLCIGTHGLVAMTSAQHAEGRQFDPGWVYFYIRCVNSCSDKHVGERERACVILLSAWPANKYFREPMCIAQSQTICELVQALLLIRKNVPIVRWVIRLYKKTMKNSAAGN